MARPGSGRFSITELRRTGGGSLIEDLVRFEWDAKSHTKPRGPIELPLMVHTVREVPAGADRPVEQVLSATFETFEFEGRWDDKWAGQGFAEQTHESMRGLVARGSLVRVQWDAQTFEGVITSYAPAYHHAGRIDYKFALSVHTPATDPSELLLAPTPKPTRGRIDEVKALIDAISAEYSAGRSVQFQDDTYADANQELVEMIAVGEELDRDNDTFGLVENAAEDLRRTAYRFSRAGAAAQRMVNRLVGVRSDLQASISQAVQILDLNVWSRGMSANARLLGLRAAESREDIEARADSTPSRIYRPRAGENVYSVAKTATGSSANWRAIVEANQLGDKFQFDGTEELVIPSDIVSATS